MTYIKLLRHIKQWAANSSHIIINESAKPDGINLEFEHTNIRAILKEFKIRPSSKQVLPGADTIRKLRKWTYKYMNNLLSKVPTRDIQ